MERDEAAELRKSAAEQERRDVELRSDERGYIVRGDE